MSNLFEGKTCKGCKHWFQHVEYRVVPFRRCNTLGCDPGCQHEDPSRVDVYCNGCVRDRNYAIQVNGNNRRAVELGVPGIICEADWMALCERHNHACAYCNKDGRIVMDHIKPLAHGGANTISNVQPLCRRCNSQKGKKSNFAPEVLNV